jgi:hypothetical protein
MKLISVKQARSIWFINIADLNPSGLNLMPIFSAMAERYKFLRVPTKIEDLTWDNGISFLSGSFNSQTHNDLFVDLFVYSNGLIADTRSNTDDSDWFLDDLLTWMFEDFNTAHYWDVLRSKLYLSELWIHTDRSLNVLNPKVEGFLHRLSSSVETVYDTAPIAFETTGIIFGNDRTIAANSLSPFRFERAENAPFGENRYYSSAPLPTASHLELLEELESILVA